MYFHASSSLEANQNPFQISSTLNLLVCPPWHVEILIFLSFCELINTNCSTCMAESMTFALLLCFSNEQFGRSMDRADQVLTLRLIIKQLLACF